MADDLTKEIKKALFASGLPLEYSAEGVLRRRLFKTISGDFTFLRAGASGEMSIDLAADKPIFGETLERQVQGQWERFRVHADWRVLVECKFRTDNVRWLFAPYEGLQNLKLREYPGAAASKGHVAFGLIFSENDPLVSFAHLDSTLLCQPDEQRFIEPPVSLRGIESRIAHGSDRVNVERHEAYSSEIRKATRQLQFAIVPNMWPAIREWILKTRAEAYRASLPTLQSQPHRSGRIFSAYLVTTAELLVLKPHATVETIRDASSIDEIADRVDAVEYSTTPSNELRDHHRRIVAEFREWPQVDLTNPNERAFFSAWEPVAATIEQLSPSITIVNYKALERCLEVHERALWQFMNRSGRSWGNTAGWGWA